jgi:hypothetical protein
MTALTRYHATERALANANTIPEVTEVVSFYDGIRKAAHALNDREAEIEAADLHIRAKRKLGQMIVAAGKAGALAKGPSRMSGRCWRTVRPKSVFGCCGPPPKTQASLRPPTWCTTPSWRWRPTWV